jgi:hypothetical protein
MAVDASLLAVPVGVVVAGGVSLALRPVVQGRSGGDPRGSVLCLAALWVVLTGLALSLTGPSVLALSATLGSIGALAGSLIAARHYGPSPGNGTVDSATSRPRTSTSWSLALLALAVGTDLLFGAVLCLVGLGHAVLGIPAGLGVALGLVLSPGFLAVASVQIECLAALSWGRFDYRLRLMLLAQAGLLLFSPTFLLAHRWTVGAALAGGALTIAMFVVALQYLYRTKQISGPVARYLVTWSFAAMLTAAGWFLWDFDRSAILLSVAVLVQLTLAFFVAVASPPENTGDRHSWLLQPFWVFLFLVLTFLTEFFLGALLDLEIAGRGFVEYIPFVKPAGSPAAVTDAFLYNGLWFAAAILASAWFLIALGFTMGPLVLLKIRETRERPQKYRLGLTVVVYALAAVYIPSLASSTPLVNLPVLASLPVIGWGFGLRAGGPFEASISLAVLVMYLGVGLLTVLFGRKALCSVMCGAALMYQGTAIHEMRQFNQTSKIGRHFLGSQLSTAYVVMSGTAVVSLFAVSLLALLRLLPAVQVANGQLDTSALPLPIELYFGGLWFVMFVSTPYVGTYNCATTGFCHWGTLSIPFARIGFFRLKVKDKRVCQECTTFECAKACPVGLVDMPLYFRTTGEYRSTKCCGVGDCVGACPYGNMYHQDVRLWLRRRLGHPTSTGPASARGGVPLPMVRSPTPDARDSHPSVGTVPRRG